jgi:hypothetical protein
MGESRLRRLYGKSGSDDEDLDAFPCEDTVQSEDLVPSEDPVRSETLVQCEDGVATEQEPTHAAVVETDPSMFVFTTAELVERERADDSLGALLIARPRTRRAKSGIGWAVGALVLVAAAGWGAFLFERTRPSQDTPGPVERPVAPRDAVAAARAGVERVTPPEPATRAVDDATHARGAPQEPSTAGPVTTPRAPVKSATAATTPSAAAPTPATPIAASASHHASSGTPADKSTAANAPTPDIDLAGSWTLTRNVESSRFNAFTGMSFAYRLQLQHQGGRITGSGRKITENGKDVDADAQTLVRVEGTLVGERLELRFVEGIGSQQRSGKYVLMVAQPNLLQGRFSSNAANSQGTVEVRRP